MLYRIKQPETKAEFKHYYHLRWKLLRAPWNQPEGSEVDDIDDKCFYVMAITVNADEKDKVIGIARLQFNSDDEAQIRYMAVTKSLMRWWVVLMYSQATATRMMRMTGIST